MFPPIEELLTHRGNMLLVERVLSFDDGGIRVEARVDGQAWYADDTGNMPAWVGIELMAQAVAALVGLVARSKGLSPRQGLLLGTREYSALKPSFPNGQALVVLAREVFKEDNGLAAFDASIELGGVQVAKATLKVFEPADFSAVLERGR